MIGHIKPQIMEKLCSTLKADSTIQEPLPSHSGTTFRKGRSLKDRLVHYVWVPKINETWLDWKIIGTFRCGQCKACTFVLRTKEFSSTTTGDKYTTCDFANCRTKGNVGKTKQELHRKTVDHVRDIQNGRYTPTSKHLWQKHNGD